MNKIFNNGLDKKSREESRSLFDKNPKGSTLENQTTVKFSTPIEQAQNKPDLIQNAMN